MANNKEIQDRLEELETKMAFQDDLLNALNEMVAKQDQEIQKLWLAKQHLKQEIKDLKTDGISNENEIPPHY